MVTDRARLWDTAGVSEAEVVPRLAIIERSDGREMLFGHEGRLGVSRPRFVLRVQLRNDGSTPLRDAAVNILVPKACRLEPFRTSGLGRMGPSRTDQLVPGCVVPVNMIAIERDYPPALAVCHYAVVTLPEPGCWPIAVVVAGDACIAWASRGVVDLRPTVLRRSRRGIPSMASASSRR